MPLNDDTGDEFASHLQDEHIFDANPPPGIEMLGIRIKTDRGSGSFAEDGRLEVAEDRLMLDGEAPYELSVGAASAADRPGFEIGAGHAATDGASEIGDWSPEQGHMLGDWSPEQGHMVGDWSPEQGHMVGDWSPETGPNSDVMGSYAMYGPTEVGSYAMHGGSEIGSYAMHGGSEIGSAAMYGPSEIGADLQAPFESFMMGPTGMGSFSEIGEEPFESFMMGPTGMGAVAPAAVAKVVETARDNRTPPPVMKAVAADVPVDEGYDESVAEFLIGAAEATGMNHFPLTAEFMQRCGAGCPPRYVRVDSEESYKAFRTEHSPEMSELSDKVEHLAAKVNAHANDPHAHSMEGPGFSDDLNADIEDLTILGEQVDAVEKSKLIELWMPKRYDGLVTAWLEGNNVCASLALPGKDGNVKICTSLEPVRKCVEEMSRHAAQSGVAETVVGVLPAMGCVLGAGTILKEVAAAAPSIVTRPEATQGAVFKPFVVRIEPKVSPALSALAMLAMACRVGNTQACKEWAKLGKLSPAPVRQAMSEALELAKGVA